MRKIVLTFLACCLIWAEAEAQNAGLKLGNPAYGGTGCPAGTASVTISPSEDAISILFDGYIAEAGGMTGKRVDRKSCNLAIPVQVPQGYSVSIFQVDYRGFNSVPRGGRNQFDVEYFFAGSRGPMIRRTFMGAVNDAFSITDRLLASAVVWSRCGESVNLRINSSMMAMSNARNEQALGMVDSADISNGLIYHIQTRRCR
jgi:hypothetical protein